MNAKYSFISWLKQGLGTYISTPDNLVIEGSKRSSLQAKLKTSSGTEITKTIQLIGPGDITGIDAKNIIKMHPSPNTGNFESNYLAFIEFYQDTFLWDYTLATGQNQRLRPWLFLLVVEESEYTFTAMEDGLDIIKVAQDNIFPPPTQTWAWGHVHVNASDLDLEALSKKMNSNPDYATCRLLSPRRLQANKKYKACVIPAFEAGRQAGLGILNEENMPLNLKPAWGNGQSTFPVYHAWDFQTGAKGDFESLVRELKAVDELHPSIGYQKMGISTSFPEVIPTPNLTEVELGGAVRPVQSTPIRLEDEPFKVQLADYLNKREGQQSEAHNNQEDPIIVPPTYGHLHVLIEQLNKTGTTTSINSSDSEWLHTLNLDPANRAAAGLGSKVVQEHQDEYLATAWDQIGAVLEANQILRQSQLGIEIATRWWDRHIASQSPGEIVSITRPLLDVLLCDQITGKPENILTTLDNSQLPISVLSPAFRKLKNKRGRIKRRIKTDRQFFKQYSAHNACRINKILPLTNSTDFILIGGYNNKKGLVCRVDQIGKIIWNKTFTNPQTISLTKINQLKNGTVLISGIISTSVKNNVKYLVINISIDGVVNWTKTLHTKHTRALTQQVEFRNGNIGIVGWHLVGGLTDSIQYFLIDNKGKLLKNNSISLVADDQMFGAILFNDDLLIVGESGATGRKGFMIKADQDLSELSAQKVVFEKAYGNIEPLDTMLQLKKNLLVIGGNTDKYIYLALAKFDGEQLETKTPILVEVGTQCRIIKIINKQDQIFTLVVDYKNRKNYVVKLTLKNSNKENQEIDFLFNWKKIIDKKDFYISDIQVVGQNLFFTGFTLKDNKGNGFLVKTDLELNSCFTKNIESISKNNTISLLSSKIKVRLDPPKTVVEDVISTPEQLESISIESLCANISYHDNIIEGLSTTDLFALVPNTNPIELHPEFSLPGIHTSFPNPEKQNNIVYTINKKLGGSINIGEVSVDKAAILNSWDQLIKEFNDKGIAPKQPRPIDLSKIIHCIKKGLHPATTITKRTLLKVGREAELDAIVPIMAAPDYSEPMYKRLLELSEDFILPNLEKLPNNSVTLLEANRPFIEAFMVGLNYEMAKELTWNEYPNDGRGSYFRQFWEVSKYVNFENLPEVDLAEKLKDILPIHKWVSWTDLGEHPTESGSNNPLVLTIRGDLLSRYPDTIIYATKAKFDPATKKACFDNSTDAEVKYPIFSAKIDPDITFLGFDIAATEANGDASQPGWFFCIKEPVGGPRFGMDVAQEETPTLNNWNDLHWGYLNHADFIHLDKFPKNAVDGTWNTHAAAMASILYQVPVLVAMHASQLLPD